MGCEAVVAMGWHTFVEVGLAFAQIRDERLYRVQFANFEAYCREKWPYGRDYVDRLISAAQVFRHLLTNSQQIKPQHETQVRPSSALVLSRSNRPRSAPSKRPAAEKLRRGWSKRPCKTSSSRPRHSNRFPRYAARTAQNVAGLVDDTLGQVLVLLSQKANHTVLTEKFETLHRQIQALFAES